MGSIERSARDGLQTIITDNAQDGRFEAAVGDQVIGRQPYRRYRGHIVLMATEVDPQWRERGVSSAMIGGVLSLIRGPDTRSFRGARSRLTTFCAILNTGAWSPTNIRDCSAPCRGPLRRRLRTAPNQAALGARGMGRAEFVVPNPGHGYTIGL
jgi:hypothetical protein